MLGNKIRAKRLQRKFSLRQLAEATGFTASFLSQIERNLAMPSIMSLRKLAEALEVPIFYFLLDDGEGQLVVRKSERKILNFPESHLTFELLTPGLNHKIEMITARLEPGAATCDRKLSHPGEECTLVLEGTMQIEVDEDVYILEEGDSIYYLCSLPHRIVNISADKDLVFVSAITPPNF